MLIYTQEKHKLDLLNRSFNIKYIKSNIIGDLFEKIKLYNFKYRIFLNKIKHDLIKIYDSGALIHFMSTSWNSFIVHMPDLKVPYIVDQ